MKELEDLMMHFVMLCLEYPEIKKSSAYIELSKSIQNLKQKIETSYILPT